MDAFSLLTMFVKLPVYGNVEHDMVFTRCDGNHVVAIGKGIAEVYVFAYVAVI